MQVNKTAIVFVLRRRLNPYEQNYPTHDLELGAIVFALGNELMKLG